MPTCRVDRLPRRLAVDYRVPESGPINQAYGGDSELQAADHHRHLLDQGGRAGRNGVEDHIGRLLSHPDQLRRRLDGVKIEG
jgi:hypothetical protein